MGSTRERGASVVEMAFVAIFLFVLTAGIIDLGRAYLTRIAVHDAAQEGAMFASYRPSDQNEIRERVIATTDNPDLTVATIEVTCPEGTPDLSGDLVGGKKIAVRVTYRMPLVTPLIGWMLGGHLDLTREHVGQVFSGECLT